MNDALIITGLRGAALDVPALLRPLRREDCGALVSFEGTVRSPSSGHDVSYLDYEAYGDVAEKQMTAIAQEVCEEFELLGALVFHRTGRVFPGEPAVLAATVSRHRKAAFDGTELLIDRVKSEAAIWKREVWPEGASWL